MPIAQFLEDLGLGEYTAVFEKEAVDFETLYELDDGDLSTLGLPLGHRKKILRAISSGLLAPVGSDAEPENRRVSVLFCDLVGSTRLSQSMSAEDLRDLLVAFQGASAFAIETHGGHVAKYLGEYKLKGVGDRVQVFRVLGRTEAKSRIDASRGRGLAKIIGRDAEIALLQSRWDRVCQGDGQVLVLSGEPGIGKDRDVMLSPSLLEFLRDYSSLRGLSTRATRTPSRSRAPWPASKNLHHRRSVTGRSMAASVRRMSRHQAILLKSAKHLHFRNNCFRSAVQSRPAALPQSSSEPDEGLRFAASYDDFQSLNHTSWIISTCNEQIAPAF